MAIELPDISKFQKRVEEIDGLMNQPDFFNDARRSAALSREQIKLRQLLENHAALESAKAALAEHKELLADPNGDGELKELALEELPELEEQVAGLESKILVSMIPPDDSDSRNTIVEILALGAGGDEASLFAGSLTECTLGWRNVVAGRSNSSVRAKVVSTDSRKFPSHSRGGSLQADEV